MKLLHTRAVRWLWRSVLIVAGLFLVAGSVAPFINASIFIPKIQRALETSLNRKVTFSSVHFSVFTGLGFSLSDVTIDEDPAFGYEPFANVNTLQARVRWMSLLGGRVAFSSLRLVEPNLNLVQSEDGRWNVVALLSRLTAESRLPIEIFPAFSVSDARIDLKFGRRKNVFYIADADLSVYPEHSGKLFVRFSGAPGRTDRSGNGFGHIRGSANWYRHVLIPNGNQLEADFTLDRSDLSELSILFSGSDSGVHGTVASHARIEGPLNALRVVGEAELADIRRWDLVPNDTAGNASLAYTGSIDWPAQSVTLRSRSNPISLEMHASGGLSRPTWSLIASLNAAPAAQLLPFGRRLGLPIPPDLDVSGSVTGAVGYSQTSGFAGEVELKNLSTLRHNVPALKADSMLVRISNDAIVFQPFEIQTGDTGSIRVGGTYAVPTGAAIVNLSAANAPVTAIRDTVGAWFGEPSFLDRLSTGAATGDMQYQQTANAAPAWSGQLAVANAEWRAPGLANPITHAQAQLRFDSDSFELKNATGRYLDSPLNFSYHQAGHANARLKLTLASANLEDINGVLAPATPRIGVLERLGVSAAQPPDWLALRHIQADVTINRLLFRNELLGPALIRALWTGKEIRIGRMEVKSGLGDINADGVIRFAATDPEYRFNVSATDLAWHGGRVSAQAVVTSSGLGTAFLRHLQADGKFEGSDMSASNSDNFDQASGAFTLNFNSGWPDVRVSQLTASENDEDWTGAATSREDGQLVIDLQREGKQRRILSALQNPPTPISTAIPPGAVARAGK